MRRRWSAARATAVGGEVGLAIDCHWNYNVRGGDPDGARARDFNLLWLEDPFRRRISGRSARYSGIRGRRSPRVRTTTSRLDFQRLIVEAGLRLLAPDVQKIGLWEGRKIADLCDMHYVNLTLHNISSPIGTMGGVHLCAAVPNVLALEWHAASVPFFDELVKDGERADDPEREDQVPDAPGLGIEMDEDVVWKYRKPGEKFFGMRKGRMKAPL